MGEKRQPSRDLVMLAYSNNYTAYEAYVAYVVSRLIMTTKLTKIMSPSFSCMGLLIWESGCGVESWRWRGETLDTLDMGESVQEP